MNEQACSIAMTQICLVSVAAAVIETTAAVNTRMKRIDFYEDFVDRYKTVLPQSEPSARTMRVLLNDAGFDDDGDFIARDRCKIERWEVVEGGDGHLSRVSHETKEMDGHAGSRWPRHLAPWTRRPHS